MAAVTQKNISELQSKLLGWFELEKRLFPWRKEGLSEYMLIIAEVLLQRTKAETVAGFYSKFIKDFPSWQSIADAGVEQIETSLKPVGLYRQRAARLLKLAREMVLREGRIPSEKEELKNIPLMGQYITNAVLLIIHRQRVPLIDVNMARVLERYFKEREMADIRYDPHLQKLALQFADHPNSKELSWAILDFAALICRARNPKCQDCFLLLKCAYYQRTLKIIAK